MVVSGGSVVVDGLNGRADVACQRDVSLHFDTATGASSVHSRTGAVAVTISPPHALGVSLYSGKEAPVVTARNGAAFTAAGTRCSPLAVMQARIEAHTLS